MGTFVGKKDLARAVGISTRSIERYMKLLNLKPTIPAWSGHRWSEPDAEKFIKRLSVYWQRKGRKPTPQPA